MTTVIVSGALANKPGNAGEAWVRLSWLLGLRRLGLDPWLIEQIEPSALAQPARTDWFTAVLDRFGLGARAVLVSPSGRPLDGTGADALADVVASAALLINISGNLTAEPLLAAVDNRAYLDLDPGYTQLWDRAGALGGALDRHHHLLTVGLALGSRACPIPTAGRTWRAVMPPVVLDEWPVMPPRPQGPLTTVASWRGGYGRLESGGRRYGQKAHEFRRFDAVPAACGANCEAALDIHPADRRDADRLRAGGWELAAPRDVAGDPDTFRAYVRASAAELSPAQGVYVETRSGWFSDRTTRYLASGRPALVQDTGLPPAVPCGEGLITFTGPDDAVRAVTRMRDDYEHHARAAARLARELCDSDVVLTALLGDLLA